MSDELQAAINTHQFWRDVRKRESIRDTLMEALTEFYQDGEQAQEALLEYDESRITCTECGNEGWIRVAIDDLELCKACPYGALEAWGDWYRWGGPPKGTDGLLDIALHLTKRLRVATAEGLAIEASLRDGAYRKNAR